MAVFFVCEEHPGVHRYMEKLAYVPEQDMRQLRGRGAAIIFADRFVDAVDNDWADRRRRRPLTPAEVAHWVEWDRTQVLAAYDQTLDAILYPLDPLDRPEYERLDREHPALHEVAHAMTSRAASRCAQLRGDLLAELTDPISEHLRRYPQGDAPAEIGERVLEALAESYRLLVAGRERDVPANLTSALIGILQGDDLPSRPDA